MNFVQEIGGNPYATKAITIPHDSWKKLSELGCPVNDGTNVAEFAFIRIPNGKQIEISTDLTADAGTGLLLEDKTMLEFQSSIEISKMYLRAIGDADIETTVLLLSATSKI